MPLFLAIAPHDAGPIYVETQMGRFPVEPWNTASNLAFLAVLVYFAGRSGLRLRRFPVTVVSQPILLVGWIGGTLYHATRGHDLWRILDAAPIAFLALLVSVYLWHCLLGSVLRAAAVVVGPALLFKLSDLALPESQQTMMFAGYAFLATLIILPAILHCRRQHWRGVVWLVGAVVSFAIALTMRQLDASMAAVLPMGSHWLWHVLGAAAAFCGMNYVYQTEFVIHDSSRISRMEKSYR
jgi:hypothetical protein